MHHRQEYSDNSSNTFVGSACSLVNQESKQDPLPPSPEKLIADRKQQKQCELYEETINSLTADINEMQRKEAIQDLLDSGSWSRAQLLVQRYIFAGVTQSNYLKLGSIRGCKFPNVNLPQQITD